MGMLMAIKSAPKAVAKTFGKLTFKLSKNKPQLMVGGGLILTTVGFVWAICSARKMDKTMEDSTQQVNELQAKIDQAENSEEKDNLPSLKKELTTAKKKGIIAMAKLMGIPVVIFASGLCLIFGGHRILVRRFSEVSAAFATLQQIFDRYRQMNIAEHGEECDRRYRYGIVGSEQVKGLITDENGKEKTIKYQLPVVDKDKACSMYTFEFSENFSSKCQKDPIMNISWLKAQQEYWNHWMGATGKPVTLYMILNDLGITLDPNDPMNDYIMIAGWRLNGDGDNYIDFGITRAINKKAFDMEENVIFLNFNCDGNIYHSPRYLRDGRKVALTA